MALISETRESQRKLRYHSRPDKLIFPLLLTRILARLTCFQTQQLKSRSLKKLHCVAFLSIRLLSSYSEIRRKKFLYFYDLHNHFCFFK